MTEDRFEEIWKIVETALDLKIEERQAHAIRACGSDTALLELVLAGLEEDAAVLKDLMSNEGLLRPDSLIGREFAGFRVDAKLDEGGSGAVYRGTQLNPLRDVAIKFLHTRFFGPGFGTTVRKRFTDESEILAKLKHSGIAQIIAAGVVDLPEGSRPYFVLEYVNGSPLDEFLKTHPIDAVGAVQLIIQVGDAISHAHQRGYIHRDIKPRNILIDERGQPKLIDFGIARLEDRANAQDITEVTGRPIGTLNYMAPEQAGSPRDVDIRCDVYALAAITYELIGGKRPLEFGGLSYPEAILRLTRDEPIKLDRIVHGIDQDLETVIHKGLAKDPSQRYASANEFVADLKRVQNREAISARPATRTYLIRQFVRRNPNFSIAVAAAVLILIAGTVATAAGMVRANAQADINRKLAWDTFDAVSQMAELAIDPLDPQDNPEELKKRIASVTKKLEHFENQEVQAAGFHAAAQAYADLGDGGKAEEFYRIVLGVRETQHGDNHADTAAAKASLAYLFLNMGRFKESADLLEGAIPAMRQQRDPRWQEPLAGALDNLARARHNLGDFESAERLFAEEIAIHTRASGASSENTAKALQNYAVMLIDAGRAVEAISLLERITPIMAVVQDKPWMLATVQRSEGIALRELHKPVEAERILRTALPAAKVNPQLSASVMVHLAGSTLDQGESRSLTQEQLNEALELLRTAQSVLRAQGKTSTLLFAETEAELCRVLALRGDTQAVQTESQLLATIQRPFNPRIDRVVNKALEGTKSNAK